MFIALAVIFTACEDQISVVGVTLDRTSETLLVGDFVTLVATVQPGNATDKTVIWTSTNTAVATVSENGLVIAKTVGSATIIVSTRSGGMTASCAITVTDTIIPVTDITLDRDSATLGIGGSLALKPTVLPTDATNKTVTWMSSNPAIVIVNSGVVIGIAEGFATITATTEDGNYTATCEVEVTPVFVTGVTLSQTTATPRIGETLTLTATVQPTNATNQTVTWTSSDTTVATVNNAGVVNAIALGSATITVTTEDGNYTATCEVTVLPVLVTGITLNLSASTRAIGGDTLILTATVQPANATNKTVIWTSSNSSVATVDNGKVIAVAPGAATITATTEDGGRTATCAVTVPTGCNSSVPGWGSGGLGTILRGSETTISGNGITQTWSGHITTTVCGKTTYAGGSQANSFNADCRSYSTSAHLFSWCAVIRFQDELCPAPWRVPTRQDFIDLDKALGGTGQSVLNPTHRDRYINIWNGEFGGGCIETGLASMQGSSALYWSSTEHSVPNAYNLFFRSGNMFDDNVVPQDISLKSYGYTLRCVR